MTGLGDEYLMREVAYKRYPVGGPDQTPLYAFLQLMRANEFTADDIEQIEVSVSESAFHTVKTNHHPSVHMETVLTLAAVYGDITFNHIHDPSYLADPRCAAFQDRARILIIPRAGRASQGARLEMGITVRTRDGEAVTQDLRYPPHDRGRDQAEVPHPGRTQNQRGTGTGTGKQSPGGGRVGQRSPPLPAAGDRGGVTPPVRPDVPYSGPRPGDSRRAPLVPPAGLRRRLRRRFPADRHRHPLE